jgi:hypothetical protein
MKTFETWLRTVFSLSTSLEAIAPFVSRWLPRPLRRWQRPGHSSTVSELSTSAKPVAS